MYVDPFMIINNIFLKVNSVSVWSFRSEIDNCHSARRQNSNLNTITNIN